MMRLFGLIGNPLTHSFSKKYFTDKFRDEQISGCSYELYLLNVITDLPALLERIPLLEGINVTIPYKEQVLAYLDEQDEVVQRVKACNCIHRVNGQLKGYNTDVTGFERSLMKGYDPHHEKALILGTGGASKAVAYVLEKLGLSFVFVTRNGSGSLSGGAFIRYDDVTPDLIRSHTLIVNTTPLGTYPDIDASPLLPYEALGKDHYLFDLVYNPAKTLFLQKGVQQGARIRNGADMLVIQAEESWRIWNGG